MRKEVNTKLLQRLQKSPTLKQGIKTVKCTVLKATIQLTIETITVMLAAAC